MSVRPSAESGLPPADVVIEARPDARVRDLAVSLGAHLGGGAHLLLAPTTDDQPWPAQLLLAESDLRTGDLVDVQVVGPDWVRRSMTARPVRAVARVVSGPDAGRTVKIEGDVLTIGRGPSCTLRLDDPAVSRVHARVLLVGGPVVVDEGSAHGTRVGTTEVVRPQPVAWDEPIRLGGTVVTLSPGSSPERRDGEVLRPPRFGPRLDPEELEVPSAPAPPRPQPLPWPMMLMPVLLGGGMFAMTRSPFSLMFMIAFPLMMVTGHVVQRRHQRKEYAAVLAAWNGEVDDVVALLESAAELQRRYAWEDEPEMAVLEARLRERHHSLWNRRVDDDDFLKVRTGRGPRPAVVTATVSRGGDRVQGDLARRDLAARAVLDDLPVPVALGEHPLVAVTGERAVVDAAVRSWLLRLAAHHSPTDVTVAAVLGPDRLDLEAWLRWLPHAAKRSGGVAPVAVGAGQGQTLLEMLAAEDRGAARTVCVVDEGAGVPRRLVESIAAAGPGRGLHLLWTGESPTRVPAATGVLVDLTAQQLMLRDRGGLEELTHVDQVRLVDAWRTARNLAVCSDEAAVVPAETAVPEQVRLADLGGDLVDPDDVTAVLERWSAARGLRAQIGAGADGVVTIDLREDGPHGLVAGTTGSGKSELLQTLLCSLALNNPPTRITFLLVDYKGGAAFRECADLPHTVGYITDLTPALVQRALVSLNAELTAREHLLAEYGAKDLVAMERDHPDAAPPSMLICVDEFAALLAEVPEFVDGMVNIAQRGRSLGMHMILATQRPAGVVTPQIKANTDLRIALRMASAEDSADVIDTDEAARLSRRTPGRAWLRRTGHGTRELVQAAWVGAREPRREDEDRVQVRPFAARDLAGDLGVQDGRTHPRADLERYVLAAGTAFVRSGLPAVARPWLPPLPERVELAAGDAGELLVGAGVTDEAVVPGSAGVRRLVPGPAALVLGLVDQPAQQRQDAFVVDYAKVGHLLVFGASASGKTELLRSAAVAATLAGGPAPAVVYGIDAGGGGLTALEVLPSVGSVVVEQSVERVCRLVRMLHRTVLDRNGLLAERGAGDLTALAAQGTHLPRIHVLVDNLPALLDSFEGGGPLRRSHVDMLLSILQEGRRCGVHVTATTPRRTGVPSAMQAAFGERLVMRLTSDDDYQMLGVPVGVLTSESAPGRALWGRHEVQVACLPGAGTADHPARLAELGEQARGRYAQAPAVPVPGMPTRLPAKRLPDPEVDDVCFGVEAEFAGGVSLRLTDGPLLVTGRAGSGRTSVLTGLVEVVRRSTVPPASIIAVGPRAGGVLAGLTSAVAAVDDGLSKGRAVVLEDPSDVVGWAEDVLAAPPASTGDAWSLVLVDDVHEWERCWEAADERRTALERLSTLAEQARSRRIALVATTDPDDARSRQHVPGLVSTLRRARRAVLLQPETADGSLVGASVPMHTHEPLGGPGRGLLVCQGLIRVVHLLSPTSIEEKVG